MMLSRENTDVERIALRPADDITKCQEALERARVALIDASEEASTSRTMLLYISQASRGVQLAMLYSEMFRRNLTDD